MVQSVQHGGKRTQVTKKNITNGSVTSTRLPVVDRVVPPHKIGAAGTTLWSNTEDRYRRGSRLLSNANIHLASTNRFQFDVGNKKGIQKDSYFTSINISDKWCKDDNTDIDDM